MQELIELPFRDSGYQQAFVTDLKVNSGGTGKFAQVTGTSGVTVTADNLSTRAPTGSPSISTAPTAFPSASPTW